MNYKNDINLYADSEAIRIFWGYKATGVEMEKFYKDLGETFMPGTPAVLAPMGLNGYLPAVLDLKDTNHYPDEVALIVYPSLPLYDFARANSLIGRIYTFSHAGVFDMAKSGGQWPGTTDVPIKHATIDRWAWRIFDKPLDWQKGQARLVTLESASVDLYEFLKGFSITAKQKLISLDINEVIIQTKKEFATIWFFSKNTGLSFDIKDLVPDANIKILNDMLSEPFYHREGNEKATIEGARFIQFRFPREQRFYL